MSEANMIRRQQQVRRHLTEETTHIKALLEELEKTNSLPPPPEDERTLPQNLLSIREVLDKTDDNLLRRLDEADRMLEAWKREPGRTGLEHCRAQQVQALIGSTKRSLNAP
jgi:hypothetical protein